MAWELSGHMKCYIEPSIYKHLRDLDDPDTETVRLLVYARTEGVGDVGALEAAETRAWGDVHSLGWSSYVDELAGHALEVATTTNGAHEVYLDEGGWNSVPWCEEEEMQEWYA